MTDITASRNVIQQEETKYNSSVSEATLTRVGASLNHVHFKQFDTKYFPINGPYYPGLGGIGVDGIFVFPFAMDIVGVFMWNVIAGSSGTTEIDIQWLSGSGTLVGSIFSTTPKITFAAGNNAYLASITASGQTASEPASSGGGLTLPVLSKTSFAAFDAIRIDLVDAQVSGQNTGIGLWVRPS